ncbi:YbaB/EbfC family nucleoid-associated protein [Buchnera aphidicola]|uniref:Nucleoid-associated protein BCc_301 n=1 Tax=Buchnera aphidicola subsp. Cinara cedri (strain Cc) TaxID=372461 RepID=Y701_BUCCC|nr:YbaB/EbfC family nucleoid-associated protein [Buchnera aphidicola]Q057E0.1 RecName: Full=Nucleoid-associated protein BCc_301 [Buchnera aphidicola BCc]ABJ90759.1 conserved hypothetical protein [Buchnera aphidicola BCc]
MYTKEKINELMEKAQVMKKEMEKIQKDIKMTKIKGESGAGLVTIFMNGNYNCRKTKINDEIWNEKNKILIQDLITSAINNAVNKITELQKKKIILKTPFHNE